MELPDKYISSDNDFRSDTFTTPTREMIESALNATIGDAVYGEDVDTLKLENYVADLVGKQQGLFCVSGTLSNQLALRTHLLQPPYSILCDHRAHVYTHESAGLAILSQAMVTPVIPANGEFLTLDDIKKHFIPDDGDIHAAPTKVVSLENTLNGILHPIDELIRIKQWCIDNDIKVHCDGARLWNACCESGVTLKQYGEIFDSISICLSKSMGAPIGSVLVGDSSFIKKANHFRKQQGGGIRQSGIICRMAMVAVQGDWMSKLKASHKMASSIAQFCIGHGIRLECPAHTNFVFIDLQSAKIDPDVLVKKGLKYGVKLMGGRISFHYQISEEAIENLKLALLETFEYAKKYPFNNTGPTQIYRAESIDTIKEHKIYKY